MRIRICVLLLIVSAVSLMAAETPIPPAPRQFVTDNADFLSPSTEARLNSSLAQYERDSGHQVLVYIGQTTGDAPIEDWAVRAFEKWKVGRKGLDDGVVLFIMAQDRRLRIEVGYGLEAQLPDALAGRIINDIIVPKIRSGDRDAAVTDGVQAILSTIGGQGLPVGTNRPTGQTGRPLTLGQIILYGIIGIIVLIVLATNPSLAVWLLMSMMSGGNRRSRGGWNGGGGGWGGGGGFSGGGGRSGGGGASGSW